MNEKPRIFGERISSYGLIHGTEEKSWFVAALSALARRPAMVKRIFVNSKYSNLGIYRYILCLLTKIE